MAEQQSSENPPVCVGTGSLPLTTSPSMGAVDRKRKQKPISFQKMAMIQEELAKIDAHLEMLRSKDAASAGADGSDNSPAGSPKQLLETITADDVIDPALMYMLIVELCQLCASGDAVGVRILLNGGADPNSRDYDDRTLLHIACVNGHPSVVKILLEFGADCLAKDRDGKTPINLAEENGFMSISQMLLTHLGDREGSDDVELDSFTGHPSSSASSPNSQYQPDFSSVPQPMVGSLIVIMVGLPGRGKSYVAQQIRRYFQWNGLSCNIFSHQTYRRRAERDLAVARNASVEAVGGSLVRANSTAVVNAVAADVEKRVTQELAKDLTKFVYRTGGVAVLDGTQTTHARRQSLLRAIKETQRIKQNRVIFVEIVNNNKEDIHRNILLARENCINPPDDFVDRYYQIMAEHESVYRTLSATTDSDLSYIRIEDNIDYSLNMISGWMPTRLAYMLHNLSHTPTNLYLTRAGEYMDMVAGRIGGNSRLTERGWAYSAVLYDFFKREIPSSESLSVMTSCSKRCTQTVRYFAEEAIKHLITSPVTQTAAAGPSADLNCRVSYFPTLDDLNHGDCEGQLLSDVRKTMPNTLQAMRADPYYTAWPNGECIHQVFNARLEPHIHDIQASSTPVLVVSHLHLLQGLYSYFVTAEDKTVDPQNAYQIDIPFEGVLRIRMAGTDRIAEIVDLSTEVDDYLKRTTGKVTPVAKPSDDFHIFQLFRPGSCATGAAHATTSVAKDTDHSRQKGIGPVPVSEVDRR